MCQKNRLNLSCANILVIITIFGAIVCHKLSYLLDCDGPPYLYVTFHSQINGIRKYSRNGCYLSENILQGQYSHINEGRDMRLGYYMSKPALYVIDADVNANKSNILLFSNCDKFGYRTFKRVVTSHSLNKGALHPFSIDFDINGNIYGSFQDTDIVLRFEKDTFIPMPSPSHVIKQSVVNMYPGLFYQFSNKKQGIRGIRFVMNNLWIANEDLNSIVIVNMEGIEIHRIFVTPQSPITLHYDATIQLHDDVINSYYNNATSSSIYSNKGMVFVSTKGDIGLVYGIDPVTYAILKIYMSNTPNIDIAHTSGITTYMNTLYVATQGPENAVVLALDVTSTQVLNANLLHNQFNVALESLAHSDC
jgi:hypothetical protein